MRIYYFYNYNLFIIKKQIRMHIHFYIQICFYYKF